MVVSSGAVGKAGEGIRRGGAWASPCYLGLVVDLPNEGRMRWILERSARLLEGGTEPVSGLVLPTAEFFPDTFDGSERALLRLLARVLKLAGLSDLEVGLAVSVDDGGGSGGSCSSGSCSTPAASPSQNMQRVVEVGDAYVVNVAAPEIGNPTVLTTALVRAVSHIFLKEAELYEHFELAEVPVAVDLASVWLGFGVLACNGSYIYAKSCGGVRVASATTMPVEELALALAIYCKLYQQPRRTVNRHLQVTPRAFFDESAVWSDSNAKVVALLGSDPRSVAAGSYTLSEARSWLGRLIGLGRSRGPTAPTDDELEQLAEGLASSRSEPIDEEKARKLAAIRELVDESLDGA